MTDVKATAVVLLRESGTDTNSVKENEQPSKAMKGLLYLMSWLKRTEQKLVFCRASKRKTGNLLFKCNVNWKGVLLNQITLLRANNLS